MGKLFIKKFVLRKEFGAHICSEVKTNPSIGFRISLLLLVQFIGMWKHSWCLVCTKLHWDRAREMRLRLRDTRR